MTTFKSLLKKHREASGLSKSELARHLDKTDAYIRKLENLGYNPPTYEICCQLSTLFTLTPSDRKAFLTAAFHERLHEDRLFYNDVYHSSTTDHPLTTHPDHLSRLSYYVIWSTKFNDPLLQAQEVIHRLEALIQMTCADFGHQLSELEIQPNQVSFTLSCSTSTDLTVFIQGLKRLSSDQIRQQFPTLTILPTLWGSKFGVFTIGDKPTADTQATVNTTQMTLHAALSHDD